MRNYVCSGIEHLRDGVEHVAKIVGSQEEAMEVFERWAYSHGGCNMTFRLFELGGEIPIEIETVEIPGPVQKVKKFKVKK